MEKKGVVVAVRTRPTGSFAQNELVIDPESHSIKINLGKSSKTGPQNQKSDYGFKYDRVLHNASQETVFQTLVSDIVQSVLEGHNGTVFAYGQTGAGKTFTMIGPTSNFKQRGISPRSISMVFQEAERRTDTDFKIQASYLEIYNERIFDLLDDVDNESQKGDFQIVDDKAVGTIVKNLCVEEVASEEDCLNLLFKGEIGRTTASHKLNKRSNRSHCIFTLYIEQRSKLGGSENIRRSKLHLVDLAGSERQKKQNLVSGAGSADVATRRESQYINKSLTFLEQVVVALTSKSRSHVPYRQTKLTHFLKDSLGGNCRTLMLACIWSESRHLEETISTCSLAQRMMKVKNRSKVNLAQDPEMLVKKYERIIQELKQELTMHDALSERTGVVYEEFTPEQTSEISGQVRKYLATPKGEDSNVIEIKSVKQIKETFRQFKEIVQSMEAEMRHKLKTGDPSASVTMGGTMAATMGDTEAMGGRGVGDLEKSGGFGLGEAPAHARPAKLDPINTKAKKSAPSSPTMSVRRAPESPTRLGSPNKGNMGVADGFFALDKNEQYDVYKQGNGREQNEKLLRLNAKKREVAASVREGTAAINVTKQQIKEYGEQLAEKKAERQSSAGEADVIDEEEFVLLKQERDAKREYRRQLAELNSLKKEFSMTKKAALKQKAAMLDAFNLWFKERAKSSPEDDDGLGASYDDEAEVLDYGEQFDAMEQERVRGKYAVMEEDPDSLAFFKARKSMSNTLRHTRNARVHKLAKKRNVKR